MKKPILIVIVIVILMLSGCFSAENFQERIYGTWVTQHKIKINDMYEPEHEYFVFFDDGRYQTNIFAHLFVEGRYVVKQEDTDYFIQLEYKGNTTTLQVTFADDDYNVLKVKNSAGVVTVFQKDESV